jgi:hypothetical protein
VNTERLYMACESANERAAQFGPFRTAQEAEEQSRRIGWKWILIYVHELDDNGRLLEVKTRFYQLDADSEAHRVDPTDIDEIRKKFAIDTNVTPMNNDEEKFFVDYEDQMKEIKWETE